MHKYTLVVFRSEKGTIRSDEFDPSLLDDLARLSALLNSPLTKVERCEFEVGEKQAKYRVHFHDNMLDQCVADVYLPYTSIEEKIVMHRLHQFVKEYATA